MHLSERLRASPSQGVSCCITSQYSSNPPSTDGRVISEQTVAPSAGLFYYRYDSKTVFC